MRQQILTDDEILAERIDVMCRVFSTADRTLAGAPVTVKTANTSNPTAAWSDGTTITLNIARINGVTSVEDLVRLNGLNYHELSHIFYTPRQGTTLVRRVIRDGLFPAFNALEDQRIETLFTARFKGTTPYFVAIMLSYVLDNEKAWEHAFPLTHGRRYLDATVRAAMEQRFFRPENVERLKVIIDRYRMMPSPENAPDAAYDLIAEYAKLCNPDKAPDPYGHGTRAENITNGRPEDGEAQQKAVQGAKEGESATGNDQQGVAEGNPTDVADGQSEGTEGQAQQDGQSGGTGAGTESPVDRNGVIDAIKKAVQKAVDDPQVQRDVRAKQRTIVHGDGRMAPRLTDKGARHITPTPQDANVVRKFARELQRLEEDLDPGLRTHKANGRINIKRAMQGSPVEEVFDQWVEGTTDATSMEVVLLLDYSSSMDSRMKDASTVLWVVKRAVESLHGQAEVTCLGFNTSANTLYRGSERTDSNAIRLFNATGGTHPEEAIQEAMRVFYNSRRKRRVLMVVTDGSWSHADANNALIQRCNDAGVLTAQVFLSDWPSFDDFRRQYDGYAHMTEQDIVDRWNEFLHGCHIFAPIVTTTDLIPFARELVKQAMRAN